MLNFFRVRPKSRSVSVKTKKGVLFRNPSVAGKTVFYLSNMLIFASIFYLSYLYLPLAITAVRYYTTKTSSEEVIVANNTVKSSIPETDIEETVPDRFKIEIPKIKANSWVVTNVSANNKTEYESVLNQDMVAHAQGSGLPGMGEGGSVFLFAHSSEQSISAVRNNPVFYLLGDMNNDDRIFADYNGKIYEYRVYGKKVVKANDTQYLDFADPSREVLILQTCWPIGTNWNRLLIFGELVKSKE
jgi:LPXTG-site transpeptidase (sortase) family protein